MFTLKRMKTLLLGLVVILITFTIIIALPAQVPSFESLSCDKIMWACTNRGIPPINYDTWMWNTPEQPDYEEWREAPYLIKETDDILDGLHFSGYVGKLDAVVDPENENVITASGYLQYGFFTEPTDDFSRQFPFPEFQGVLRNRPVQIILNKYYENERVVEELEVTTDRDGFFSVDLELDSEVLCYEFGAKYISEIIIPPNIEKPVEYYFHCSIWYSTCKAEFEFKEPGIPWWVGFIFGIVFIIIGLLVYWYLKHRGKRIASMDLLPPVEEMEIPKITEKKERGEIGGDLSQIKINFPDIEAQFPSVWGVGEPLTVLVQLKDRNGESLHHQSCQIDFGDEEIVQTISDDEGHIRLEHIFNTKGEYVINVSYQDERTGKEVTGWRKIRVVEYREEMVRLFNEMLDNLNIRDIRIEPEMTAREVEALLTERLKGVPVETVRKVVAGFEEANYSVHSVTRESYKAMYPAVKEVLNYE